MVKTKDEDTFNEAKKKADKEACNNIIIIDIEEGAF
jgi:hypothetical protein